jgi:hypothetical protein
MQPCTNNRVGIYPPFHFCQKNSKVSKLSAALVFLNIVTIMWSYQKTLYLCKYLFQFHRYATGSPKENFASLITATNGKKFTHTKNSKKYTEDESRQIPSSGKKNQHENIKNIGGLHKYSIFTTKFQYGVCKCRQHGSLKLKF